MDSYRGPRRSPSPRGRPSPRDRPFANRDEHPDVRNIGRGESYQPGRGASAADYRARPSGPANGSWSRDERRDDRRDERRDLRRDDVDSYIPSVNSRIQRPRSRSPPPYRRSRSRGREDLFPERTRSPPRRFSPLRDTRPRSPRRRRSRSPYAGRPRSPFEKRTRDYSPDIRRSPRQGRFNSPDRNQYDRTRSPNRRQSPVRGDRSFRPRSRSPPRRPDVYRRRSPSPRITSSNASRRSSPPLHPDRASLAGSAPRSPAPRPYNGVGNDTYRSQPHTRQESPPPRTSNQRAVSSQDEYPEVSQTSREPPTGPSGYVDSHERAPPTGPSRGYSQDQRSPPSGPAASSTAAYNRGPTPALSAPTRPRGGPPGRFEGPPRDFGTPPVRGRGQTSLTYRAPGYRSGSYQDGPPSGPRGGGFGAGRGDFGGGRGEYSSRGDFASTRGGGFGRGDGPLPFRGNNSSSKTYPMTQRFDNAAQRHLSTTEKIVPGGKLLPSGMNPEQEKRLKQLEAEAERIRGDITEKQRTKREAVTEWENKGRESARESLRSELAEEHLQKLMEEDRMTAAF